MIFKLYNQLHGVKRRIFAASVWGIIKSSAGDSGYITFRYGGKEFAVLLPRYDLFCQKSGESISKQIFIMNNRI